MTPFFTVIIPTFNRAHLLQKAIDSVLAQTNKNYQLLIIDDGSTDQTKEIVQTFQDQRIEYIYQDNAELSAARNTGIKHSKGDFICFLDDDDTYLAQHLATLEKGIRESQNKAALFRTSLIVRTNESEQPGIKWDGQDSALKFVWDGFVGITTFCFPRILFDKYLFPVQYVLFEDKHFLARVLLEYPLVQIMSAPTVIYNVYEDSRSFTAYQDDARLQNQVSCIHDLFESHGQGLKEVLGDHALNEKCSNFYYQAAQQALRNKDKKFFQKRLNEAKKYNGNIIRRLKYLKLRLKALWL